MAASTSARATAALAPKRALKSSPVTRLFQMMLGTVRSSRISRTRRRGRAPVACRREPVVGPHILDMLPFLWDEGSEEETPHAPSEADKLISQLFDETDARSIVSWRKGKTRREPNTSLLGIASAGPVRCRAS